MGAFCTIFRARPVGTGLGTEFGRKPAKNHIKLIMVYYLFKAKVALSAAGCPGRPGTPYPGPRAAAPGRPVRAPPWAGGPQAPHAAAHGEADLGEE